MTTNLVVVLEHCQAGLWNKYKEFNLDAEAPIWKEDQRASSPVTPEPSDPGQKPLGISLQGEGSFMWNCRSSHTHVHKFMWTMKAQLPPALVPSMGRTEGLERAAGSLPFW